MATTVPQTCKIFLALSTLFLVACGTTGSSIVTGKTRPAIASTEVKIYLDPPAEFETIGMVEGSSEVDFSTQAAQDRAINELKAQAAKIGANGVLLLNTGDKTGDIVGFTSGGMFYGGASEAKTAKGRAIFVIRE